MPYLHILRLLHDSDPQYSYKCRVLGHIEFATEDDIRKWWDWEGSKVWGNQTHFKATGRSGWRKDVGAVVRSCAAPTGPMSSMQFNQLMLELH